MDQDSRRMDVEGAALLASFVDKVSFRRASHSAGSDEYFLQVSGDKFRRETLMFLACVAQNVVDHAR